MNRQEHLLTILNEELGELAIEILSTQQQITKALRFGIYEQRDLSTSNCQRIFKEFNDLLAMVDMVNESAIKTSFDDANVTLGEGGIMYRDEELIKEKKKKVEKYLLYSKKLGTLDDFDYETDHDVGN